MFNACFSMALYSTKNFFLHFLKYFLLFNFQMNCKYFDLHLWILNYCIMISFFFGTIGNIQQSSQHYKVHQSQKYFDMYARQLIWWVQFNISSWHLQVNIHPLHARSQSGNLQFKLEMINRFIVVFEQYCLMNHTNNLSLPHEPMQNDYSERSQLLDQEKICLNINMT